MPGSAFPPALRGRDQRAVATLITVEGLSYRFRDSEDYALRAVSLAVRPGEFLVITGPSGCGKSTLGLALGGHLWRQHDGEGHGSVIVAGMDARSSPLYDVAEAVGLVQQNPEAAFCTLTVCDEVAFGLENRCLPRGEIVERVIWALDVVGASHLVNRGLATLSGGEKQKVAIAAILAARPQVLILDEPTSNLDPPATADLFKVIARIRARSGMTVLVIEHKVDYLLPFEPRLVVMDKGVVTYDGPFDEVFLPPSLESCGSAPIPVTGEPLLRVQGLCAGHDGRQVLHDISLEVHPGEFVAVMGDNGSGKTTFLLSVLGLVKPMQGRVEVLGHDTRQTPVSRLAREVGLVFQNPDHQIFADSVWQEAAFAANNLGVLDGRVEERITGLLARSGLENRRHEHPYRLSYGQKRRLNLVSVLPSQPRLLLLDEMLIGQDPANAAFLLALLAEHSRQGGAVLLVSHAPEVARWYANRLLFLEGGRLVQDAPPAVAFDWLARRGRRAYLPTARSMAGSGPSRLPLPLVECSRGTTA